MATKPMSQPMPSSYLANRGYKVWNHSEEPMIRQPANIFNHNNNQFSFSLNSHHLHHSSHHDNRKDLDKLTKKSVAEEINEKRRKNLFSMKMTIKPMNRPQPSYLSHRGYKVWDHAEEPMIRPPPSIYSHNNHNSSSLRWNRSHHDLGKLIEETVAEEVNERWQF